MTKHERSGGWEFAKFGIGQPVRRTEDPVLVRGLGRYSDDLQMPRQAHAVIVRSTHAHGHLRKIDIDSARDMPGVLCIYTAADLTAYGNFKCIVPFKSRDGSDMKKPIRHALAEGKVRFVGDPVACVVAETLLQAKDAAEAIGVEIDPLPAVTDARKGTAKDAPQLFDDAPGNIALDYHYGDADKVAAAFKSAAHVTKLHLVSNRVVVNAMEPRAAIGEFDNKSGRWTLHAQSQGAFGMKNQLADILKTEAANVRILTGNVGGSFGMKAAVYPEYVCILHASKMLGRPVKWTDERSGSFVSDHQGRDHEVDAELALDAEGNFLAVRLTVFGNMGAYLGTVAPLMPTLNAVKNTPGVYLTPLIEVSTKCVFTNTTFVSAYRGAGRPEGNFYMERLIDAAALDMKIDRLALRRKNHIKPSQMPFKASSGMLYDSGDFPAVFKAAVEAGDIKGFAARRRESKKNGKLRGLGIGSYLEVTAPPGREMGGIRFETNGDVTLITGTLDYGQGHAAPFAQVLSAKLGIPFDKIKLLQGDSDELIAGGGTGGSRSMYASGAAIVTASQAVIARGQDIASHMLEASAGDIEFADGRFVIAGTDRGIGIMEMAEKLRETKMPEGTPSSLDVKEVTEEIPSAFPNGCHVAEIEIDTDTGIVEVVRYASVNDFGTIVNPLMVEGQVHGGVVQGIGQALYEHVVYDAEGQLLSGSFMDYAMPRARMSPEIGFISHPVPATTNPLGVKGCGEAGCAGGLASVMNAIADALASVGAKEVAMPVTPQRVWAALQAAKAAPAV